MCFNTRMLYSNLWRYYTEMRITSSVLEMYKDFRCLCKLRIYFKNQLKNLARFQSRINNCIIMTWHLVNLEAQFQSHCPIWWFYRVESWNSLTCYRLFYRSSWLGQVYFFISSYLCLYKLCIGPETFWNIEIFKIFLKKT